MCRRRPMGLSTVQQYGLALLASVLTVCAFPMLAPLTTCLLVPQALREPYRIVYYDVGKFDSNFQASNLSAIAARARWHASLAVEKRHFKLVWWRKRMRLQSYRALHSGAYYQVRMLHKSYLLRCVTGTHLMTDLPLPWQIGDYLYHCEYFVVICRAGVEEAVRKEPPPCRI